MDYSQPFRGSAVEVLPVSVAALDAISSARTSASPDGAIERVSGLDNDKGLTPVEQPRQQYEYNSDSRIGPARFCVAFLEHGQLLAQK